MSAGACVGGGSGLLYVRHAAGNDILIRYGLIFELMRIQYIVLVAFCFLPIRLRVLGPWLPGSNCIILGNQTGEN